MNSSDFILNIISSKVSYSSFTVLYRIFLISISEFWETITISSNGSLISGLNLDKPSECYFFLDVKKSILKELFNKMFPHNCSRLAECLGIPFFEPNMNSLKIELSSMYVFMKILGSKYQAWCLFSICE